MKPTSIIILILSVILIAAGVITCTVANNMAKEEGQYLFDADRSDTENYTETHDLAGVGVTRISLSMENTDVYVYGNAPQSKVVLYNFGSSLIYGQSGKNITVSDAESFFSLVKIADDSISFGGLSELLFSTDHLVREKPKKVEIYLAKNEAVKVLDIKLSRGNLSLQDLRMETDYTLTVGQGDVVISGLSTGSKLNITLDKGVTNLSDVRFGNGNVQVSDGSLIYSFPNDGTRKYTFQVDEGHIMTDGTDMGHKYRLDADEPVSSLTARVGKGDIAITHPAPQEAPEVDVPTVPAEDEAETEQTSAETDGATDKTEQ